MTVTGGVLAQAWEWLAAAAWPYAALLAAVTWLAVAARLGQDDTAKTYGSEGRLAWLVTWYQPAAVQPGTIPAVPEAWHDFPAGSNGWGLGTGGYKKYRMLCEGSVEVSISLRLIGTKTDGTSVFAAGGLPSGYQPGTVTGAGKYIPCSLDTSGAVFYAGNHTPYLVFRTDGSVVCFGINAAGLNQLDCHGTIPLI